MVGYGNIFLRLETARNTPVLHTAYSFTLFISCSIVQILVLPQKWKSLFYLLKVENEKSTCYGPLCFFYDQAPERSKQPFCHSQEIATIPLKDRLIRAAL